AFVVDGDVLGIGHLWERDRPGVVAGEGGLELVDHALAERRLAVAADLLQERREQPAADAPGRAVGADELGRREAEVAVDIDLLVDARAVAAVFLGGLVDGDLHRRQDLAGELAAADRIEGDGRAGVDQRLREVVEEGGRGAVDDVPGADAAQQAGLLGTAHDVDQGYAVL